MGKLWKCESWILRMGISFRTSSGIRVGCRYRLGGSSSGTLHAIHMPEALQLQSIGRWRRYPLTPDGRDESPDDARTGGLPHRDRAQGG